MCQLGAWVDGQLAAAVHLHTAAGLLTAYAARRAREEGAALVALEVATPEAERVYTRVGFSRVAERVEYIGTAQRR